jgi:ribosome biogenesis protein MAK21
MLIQQISVSKQFSADRFYRTLYESLLDPRLITTSKHILYLNLLYRALKADVSIKRVQAFVKRLLQIIHLHEPPFICGVLYLIKELIVTFPSIKSMLSTPEDNASYSGDEYNEQDVGEKPSTGVNRSTDHLRYDPRKRDPDHAHADISCLWELLPLQAHYHPSVNVLASKLLNQEPITEKADPTIYTLINFLDKFSYRNAKTKPQATHGSSIMQPMAGTSKAADYLVATRDGDKLHAPVNSESFWRKKVDDVREDEVFFHTYFEKAGKAKSAAKKEKKRKKDDEEDEASGEDEIWQALVNSKPDVEGNASGDEDGFDDFDMDDMDDDDDADVGADMDGGVELNLGSDDDSEDPGADAVGAYEDEEIGDDTFDLEDEDDFINSDEDVPIDINDDTDMESPPPLPSKSKKGKEKEEKQKGRKKQKLKHLPLFASVDDYAKLLGGDDNDT